MNIDAFNEHTQKQIDFCLKTLGSKGEVYAKGKDRLDQFKKIANLEDRTPVQSILSLMSKHITALYDFGITDEKQYKQWEEKITDTINYLLLLNALLIEREDVF